MAKLSLVLFVLLALFCIAEAVKISKSCEKSKCASDATGKVRKSYHDQKRTRSAEGKESKPSSERKAKSSENAKSESADNLKRDKRSASTEKVQKQAPESSTKPEKQKFESQVNFGKDLVPQSCQCDCVCQDIGKKSSQMRRHKRDAYPTININNYIKDTEMQAYSECQTPEPNDSEESEMAEDLVHERVERMVSEDEVVGDVAEDVTEDPQEGLQDQKPDSDEVVAGASFDIYV
jgi:hypothetical protein